ncbi:MAG: hypothetical protein JRN57_01395 [Nitrososphaerota archaeon]|nr:hypothetical protein [Nitrososphaerota archaeon]MDG7010750.1 hypothetical protein [Nitrososphaerota archaeon]
MQPPDELMTQVFLPSMRQLVAARLRSQGLSQNRISSLLGITQASVSIYLSSDRKKTYAGLSTLGVAGPDADRYASQLSTALAKGPTDGVRALAGIWTGLLGNGSVCDAHRRLHPSLAGCDFCIVEYGRRGGEKEAAVAEVAEAVRVLEGSKYFAEVMPEVSVNIACAAGDAATPSDVVAVPGRIVKVKGRAKAMLPPEAGASVHMARMLLLARSRQPELRACINLRFDRRMEGVLRRAGLRTFPISGVPRSGVDDPTFSAFERKLRTSRGRFDAVIDEGGGGTEPNLYLFARGARDVAELAIRLAGEYSAS